MKYKTIINFKPPIDKNGNYLIDINTIGNFRKWLSEELGEECLVLVTPYDVTSANITFSDDVELESVNIDTLTLKQFLEKHNIDID